MDLRIENLTRSFPGGAVLHYPTFSAQGGLVALTGPNGSGKSTLLRLLATTLSPDDGDAWLDGISLRQHGRRMRHRIGWSPGGDGGFFPRDTALSNLRLLAGLLGKKPSSVDDAIAFCDPLLSVKHLLSQSCGSLSTGQRARLNVCRALMGSPSLVLLDEPTRGMDEESQVGCWSLLAAYGKRGLLIAATHDRGGVAAATRRWELKP